MAAVRLLTLMPHPVPTMPTRTGSLTTCAGAVASSMSRREDWSLWAAGQGWSQGHARLWAVAALPVPPRHVYCCCCCCTDAAEPHHIGLLRATVEAHLAATSDGGLLSKGWASTRSLAEIRALEQLPDQPQPPRPLSMVPPATAFCTNSHTAGETVT